MSECLTLTKWAAYLENTSEHHRCVLNWTYIIWKHSELPTWILFLGIVLVCSVDSFFWPYTFWIIQMDILMEPRGHCTYDQKKKKIILSCLSRQHFWESYACLNADSTFGHHWFECEHWTNSSENSEHYLGIICMFEFRKGFWTLNFGHLKKWIYYIYINNIYIIIILLLYICISN